MNAKTALALLGAATLAGAAAAPEDGPRPNRWGYDFPRNLDAEIAAPDVHRVRYEDDHVQFVEVSNPPGYQMQMHGHPYPAVFARMSGGTTPTGLAPNETFLDPNSRFNAQNWRHGMPPQGIDFPNCTAADPQAPHMPRNTLPAPLHFYRLELKRLDDEEGGTARYARAPVEQVRFDSDAVRLVEVTVQPGATHSTTTTPTVYAFDTLAAYEAVNAALDPRAGRSPPPQGMQIPRCITAGPWATTITNRGSAPLHFYRMDFKRIDGPDLATRWREWYPFMIEMLR